MTEEKLIMFDTHQTVAGMMDVKKKPIVIQAKQIDCKFIVNTLEGPHFGKPGDYLMRGVRGELYVCDQEIFKETYDIVGT